MNDMTVPNSIKLTMSSREIAELTGKRHPDVRRDIRNMLDVLGKGVSSFARTYKDAQNKDQEEYALDRDLTLTLVSGYDIPLRHRVVTRLAELEARPAQQLIPQTLPEALRLAADLAEQRNVAIAQLAIATPKVEAFDRIKAANGMLCFRDAAKTIGIQEKTFKLWLLNNDWCYMRPGKNRLIGRSEKIAMGYLDHKLTSRVFADGTTEEYSQMVFTPKGIARLAEIFAKNKQMELV